MSTTQTIHREAAELWNARDYDGMRKLMDAEYTYTASDGTEGGIEAAFAVTKMYIDAFPDAKMDLKRVHTDGQISVAEFIVEGTHNGELMGVAPTGRRVRCVLCVVAELRDGKIYRERDYFDRLSLLTQIGAAPQISVAAST